MSYILYLGDRTYSSWSLRGWLLIEKFGLNAEMRFLDFTQAGTIASQIPQHSPARTVPTLITGDGAVVSESLAIAEELASRHPDAGIWPADPVLRATARTLAAEMCSSFTALRRDCPMNLSTAFAEVTPSPEVQADLRRLELIWSAARAQSGGKSPWLCGAYSAADAFFAPVAARIAGYGLEVAPEARAYVEAHLADASFRQWRAMGQATGLDLPRYHQSHPKAPWPGPTPRPARAVETGTPENSQCPYSGEPGTYLAEIDGRIFGFCNAFCRDKTVADADAFPAFTALLYSV